MSSADGAKRRFGHVDIPLQRVHIELTNVCDFNCVFCPKSTMTRKYGYMDPALAMRIITELRDEGICEKVTFHVMGEPTIHPQFFEILDHARAVGIKAGLTTNGGGLGGKPGQRLIDYPLHQVDVSFQTPDEKSFTLREARGLTFDQYRDGALEFFGKYHKRHPETIFKFRFLNTRFQKKSMRKKMGAIDVISSTEGLRETFAYWAGRIYDIVGADPALRQRAMRRINKLVSYKWNVIEVCPNVHFETYLIEDWGHAFDDSPVREAWGGYCFGMRDHFAILHSGDVTLCCMDYDGRTAVGNLNKSTLREILSGDEVGRIVDGFRKLRVVHPYCKRCLGSGSFASWLMKPILSVTVLKLLKPIFYVKTRL